MLRKQGSNFRNGELLRTIRIPGRVGHRRKLIPHDPKTRAFTTGRLDGRLEVIGTKAGSTTIVFDFSTNAAGEWPQVVRTTKDGSACLTSTSTAYSRPARLGRMDAMK